MYICVCVCVLNDAQIISSYLQQKKNVFVYISESRSPYLKTKLYKCMIELMVQQFLELSNILEL